MGKRKSTRPRVVEALEERQLLSGGLGYLLPHEPVMHFRQISHQANQQVRREWQSGVGGRPSSSPASTPLAAQAAALSRQQWGDRLNRQQYRELEYPHNLRLDLGCHGGRAAGIEHHGRGEHWPFSDEPCPPRPQPLRQPRPPR